eukprot:CAMPEP_0174367202 /NCGR_PEP_ID=MMETSP0811_2-20130205/84370_1 /TAXON_ID=73025 ORGANISM="Eutreptiella gymnastica-like, Strain CCMP1594" /NCGR_SAMPLE_ID=MMETSP0811_2 /ASSEMBLY_ACC=CAM_ASM_000667 /LENGTH=67 /DNA_ID=CAMNT_0015509539 /DNA_START=576 /DNA_END=779 /DNA_ORIENTATION=-
MMHSKSLLQWKSWRSVRSPVAYSNGSRATSTDIFGVSEVPMGISQIASSISEARRTFTSGDANAKRS